jgi:hypothetical protein
VASNDSAQDGASPTSSSGSCYTCDLEKIAAPPIVHEVLRAPGEPLDKATRSFMEQRLGHDFSAVRVHVDGKAAASAQAVQAVAYTVGTHVVFANGKASSETTEGRYLLAHELSHVIQQSRGGPAPAFASSESHEEDARTAAMDVATGLSAARVAGSPGIGLARQPNDGEWAAIKAIAGDFIEQVLGAAAKSPGGVIARRAGLLPKARQLRGALERIISRGGPNAAVAQRLLDQVNEGVARMNPSGELSAGRSAVTAEQTAIKAETAAANTETAIVRAEGATAELGSFAEKAGIASKLGSILEAALPGPQDVLFLWIGFFGSLAEAKQKLSDESYSLHFSEGVAARLLGFEPDWVNEHLQYRSFSGSVGERVAGFSGVKEKAANRGVVDGYAFVRGLDGKQRGAFLKDGFATLFQKSQRVGHVAGQNFEFNFDDILALGLALKPRLDQMLEVAREQAAERERQLELRRSRARDRERGHGWART